MDKLIVSRAGTTHLQGCRAARSTTRPGDPSLTGQKCCKVCLPDGLAAICEHPGTWRQAGEATVLVRYPDGGGVWVCAYICARCGTTVWWAGDSHRDIDWKASRA